MTTHTVAELFNKRNEIAGQIIQTEKQARRLRSDLAAIESAIRVMYPDADLPKIVPRRVEYRPRHFKRGQLTRLILEFLRDHTEPVAVADIMPVAVGDRSLSQQERYRLAVTVYQALMRLAKRGIVERISNGRGVTREGHRHTLWRLVPRTGNHELNARV